MKKLISLCFLFALKFSVNAITISTLDEQFSQNNQTVLRFKIENNSNDTLKEIELRYHVKQETARIAEPDLFYLPDGMANWSFEDSLNATLIIYFPNVEHSPHENSTKQAYDNFFENTFDWNLDFEINNTRVLNSGENLTSGLLSYNFRKVDFNFNSGSSLILNVPGEFYAGALKFQKDSKLIPQTNGSVIFYVGNDFQWNGTILVHQDAKVTWVPFLRETVNAVIAGVYK